MLIETLAVVIVLVVTIESREVAKINKVPAAISDSLVNLGKLDISFYFNSPPKPQDSSLKNMDAFQNQINPYYAKPMISEEPCPCSNVNSFGKDPPFFGNPSDILNKILTGNNLLSPIKNLGSSLSCCNSHEQVHEETVIFDVSKPNTAQGINPLLQAMPQFQLPLETLFGKPLNPKIIPKNKAIEIFFFPKKRDYTFELGRKQPPKVSVGLKKDTIQAVGDKELKNDFKNMKLLSSMPLSSSVKKDLNIQEKKKVPTTTDEALLDNNNNTLITSNGL